MNLLNSNISYEVPLAKGVYWVPISVLGASSLDIDISFLNCSVEQKREAVHTLYDAVHLFIEGRFLNCSDAVRIQERDNQWEHHKDGFHAVRTNEGCCASSASWLSYMISDRYDEVGLIAIFRNSKYGHVLNYIKHKAWFYIIDMMMYTDKYICNAIPEDGSKFTLSKRKFITSAFCKTNDLKLWEAYYNRYYSASNNKQFCIAISEANMPPISVENLNSSIIINLPHDIEAITISNLNNFLVNRKEGPRCHIDWNYLPSKEWRSEIIC